MTSDKIIEFEQELARHWPVGSRAYRDGCRMYHLLEAQRQTVGHGMAVEIRTTEKNSEFETWLPNKHDAYSIFSTQAPKRFEEGREVELGKIVRDGKMVMEEIPFSVDVVKYIKEYGIKDMRAFTSNTSMGGHRYCGLLESYNQGDHALVFVTRKTKYNPQGQVVPGELEVYRDGDRIWPRPLNWHYVDRAEEAAARVEYTPNSSEEAMRSPAPNNVVPLFPAVAEVEQRQPHLEELVSGM